MNQTHLNLDWKTSSKWIDNGMKEIINRFNLKLPENRTHMSYCFVKKNTNRYFKKHLGFSYKTILDGSTEITITDYKKLTMFRIKYGL